ncbi:Hypothetical predicted protein [Mytilus galloprovincialis]|uniref:Histidine N-acetyltransferase C-terminal domain-containing protein n=1 Tax=Mytilus galloprovincialis TaxID=29158 RepID=A0A8B6E5D8_MYTGA|nr:Hypothetical predicted protein [Mytilus galloprovincialis]
MCTEAPGEDIKALDPFSPPKTLYSSEPLLCDICRPVIDNGISNPSDVDVRLLRSRAAIENNITAPVPVPIVCNIPDGCNIQDPSIEMAGCNPVIETPLETFCRKLLALINDSVNEGDSASRSSKQGKKKGYRKYGRYGRKRKNKPKYIDVNLLGEVLASIDQKQYLFPEDEIVAENVPYMAIKSNAPLIVSKRTTVVVSDLNCPQRTLLSISNCWQAPIGMMCNLNVYDCWYENIKEHLILHFAKFLCRSMRDYIILRGISSKGTSFTFLDIAVVEFGLKRTDSYGTGVVSTRRRIQHEQ